MPTTTSTTTTTTTQGLVLLTVFVQATLSLHACLDAVHVLCVLFPAFMARRLGEERALCAAELYISLFSEQQPQQQQQQPPQQQPLEWDGQRALLRRALAYWVAAMSLTRLTAVVYTNSTGALGTAALMYLLEALSFEFEGSIGGSVPHRAARVVSVVSLSLCIATLFLAVR